MLREMRKKVLHCQLMLYKNKYFYYIAFFFIFLRNVLYENNIKRIDSSPSKRSRLCFSLRFFSGMPLTSPRCQRFDRFWSVVLLRRVQAKEFRLTFAFKFTLCRSRREPTKEQKLLYFVCNSNGI